MVDIKGDFIGRHLAAKGELRTYKDPFNGTDFVSLKAPAILNGNVVLTLPNSQGSAGYALMTPGAGALAWAPLVQSVNITQPAAGITASGGPITSSGSITLALANDLAAIEGIASNGIAVRTNTDTWTTRTITGSGAITVSNGDGVSGDPIISTSIAENRLLGRNSGSGTGAAIEITPGNGLTIGSGFLSLDGDLVAIAQMTTTGMIARTATNTWVVRTITGTTNQITLSDGDGIANNPTIAIANNAIMPGSQAITLPIGNTAARGTPANGMIRYNSETSKFEAYENNTWSNMINALPSYTTVNGAGGDQAGATAVSARYIAITAGSADTGIRLPASANGYNIKVFNYTAARKKIYPTSGERFNAGTADAFVYIAPWSYIEFNSFDTGGYFTVNGGNDTPVSGAVLRSSNSGGRGVGLDLYTPSGVQAYTAFDDGRSIISGAASLTLPIGNTAARPTPVNGMIRYNNETNRFEGYENSGWLNITSTPTITSNVTATGTTQGTAASINSDLVRINAGVTDTGVILPAAIAGRRITIINGTSTVKYVYPAVGEFFEGTTAFSVNRGARLSAGAVATLYCAISGQWNSPGLWQAGSDTSAGLGGMIQTGDGASTSVSTLVNPDQSSSLSVSNNVLAIGGVGVWHQGNLMSNIGGATGGHYFRSAGILVSNFESSSSTYDVAIKVSPSNGAALTTTVRLKPVATSVNNILITNAASGASPNLSAEGTDTNINLAFDAKGTAMIDMLDPVRLPTYTTAGLPSAATFARSLLYVSDGSSSRRLGLSNGSSWLLLGEGTVTSVNLTQPAAGITVSGGPVTTSGSITLALANDLAAIEGLASNGIAVRTNTDTWTTRTITQGNGIVVTNGDGVSGNPTIAADFSGSVTALAASGTAGAANTVSRGDHAHQRQLETFTIACSNLTTDIVTGAPVAVFRMPYAFTVTAVRASLATVSSSGVVTVDINESNTSILSTKLTIDANEKTSTTAATPAVISDTALADDAEITIDIDTAGTGARGLVVYIIGRQS